MASDPAPSEEGGLLSKLRGAATQVAHLVRTAAPRPPSIEGTPADTPAP